MRIRTRRPALDPDQGRAVGESVACETIAKRYLPGSEARHASCKFCSAFWGVQCAGAGGGHLSRVQVSQDRRLSPCRGSSSINVLDMVDKEEGKAPAALRIAFRQSGR